MENDPSEIVRVPMEHDSLKLHISVVDIGSSGLQEGAYIIGGYEALGRILVANVVGGNIGLENFARLCVGF